jgi:hypothetical protein
MAGAISGAGLRMIARSAEETIDPVRDGNSEELYIIRYIFRSKMIRRKKRNCQ